MPHPEPPVYRLTTGDHHLPARTAPTFTAAHRYLRARARHGITAILTAPHTPVFYSDGIRLGGEFVAWGAIDFRAPISARWAPDRPHRLHSNDDTHRPRTYPTLAAALYAAYDLLSTRTDLPPAGDRRTPLHTLTLTRYTTTVAVLHLQYRARHRRLMPLDDPRFPTVDAPYVLTPTDSTYVQPVLSPTL